MSGLKVSMAVTTYNQEKYLAECLDSILVQKTNFNYEILIADDASTDQTRLIAESYFKKHPDKIRLLSRDKNIGTTRNLDDTLKQCSGEYIVIFDGDDIMRPGKLQKQVDFLDSNPEYVLVAHHLNEFQDPDRKTTRIIKPPVNKKFYGIKDLIRYGSLFGNTSKMFRRTALPPNGIHKGIHLITDMYITLHIVKEGKAGYIPIVLGDYRRHVDAMMNNANGKKIFEDIVLTLDSLDNLYGNKYKYLYRYRLAYGYFMYGIHEMHSGNFSSARHKFLQSIRHDSFRGVSQYIYLIMSFLPPYFIKNKIVN